jgi:hypothetical protein
LKPAAAAAEMAYKKSRPALPPAPTAQFPEHIIEVLNQAWLPDPIARPEFSQILPELEQYAPMDEQRQFSIIGPLSNQEPEATIIREESEDNNTDMDEDGGFGLDEHFSKAVGTTVSRLKDRWEQLSVAEMGE